MPRCGDFREVESCHQRFRQVSAVSGHPEGVRARKAGKHRFRFDDRSMSFTGRDVVAQETCHGDFRFRSLTEAHAYGVSDSLGQQRRDACRALDASVFAVAGFCNPEMERVVHPFFLHLLYEQTHGGRHHLSVGGLY